MTTTSHSAVSDAESYDSMAKRYKNHNQYNQDAEKLLKDGWLPEEVFPRTRLAPWWMWICIGPFALLTPRHELTVRYGRVRVRKGYVRCYVCATVNRATSKAFPCTNCGTELKR